MTAAQLIYFACICFAVGAGMCSGVWGALDLRQRLWMTAVTVFWFAAGYAFRMAHF